MADNEAPEAFQSRMRLSGIAYAGNPETLKAARALADAEVLGAAVDMYFYWLEGASPGSRSNDGVATGLELALQLSEADESDMEGLLIRKLRKVYPADPEIAEAFAELESPQE
jgi:hypothetical protein